jgi:hypothetical protein
MNDLRMDMPFSDNELQDYLREINGLRKMLAEMDGLPVSPAILARKIILLTEQQHAIGEIYAQMVYEHSVAYVERKNAFAMYRDAWNGTEKEKDAYAEEKTKDQRMFEAKCKSNMERWKMQYNNAEQRANAVKKHYEVIFDDYKQRGGRSGG